MDIVAPECGTRSDVAVKPYFSVYAQKAEDVEGVRQGALRVDFLMSLSPWQ